MQQANGHCKMSITEHIYRTLIQTLPDIMYELDEDGYFLYLNDAVTKIGYDPDALTGRHFSAIIYPDDINSVQRSRVVERLRGQVVGDERTPRLFDERRTGKRLTSKLLVRLQPGVAAGCNPSPLSAEVISIGMYRYAQDGPPRFTGTLGVIRILKEVDRSLKAMAQLEQHYRLLLENSSDVITILAHDGTVLFKSHSVVRILGYDPMSLIGESEFDYLDAECRQALEKKLKSPAGEEEEAARNLFLYRNAQNDWRTLKTSVRRITGDDNNTRCFVLNAQDVTEQRDAEAALRDSEERYRNLVEKANDLIFETSADGKLTFVNPVTQRMTGYTEEEIVGKPFLDIVHPDYRDVFRRHFGIQLLKKIPTTYYEYPIINKSGEEIWLGQNTQITVRNGEGTGYQGVARDITELHRMQDRLTYLSTHDYLTELPNRLLFQDKLAYVLASVKRRRQLAGVLFMDLDGFKSVNDLHGHDVGDMLLKSVAKRLVDCVREIDIVSRLGGDEFTVIIESAQALDEIVVIAKRIIATIAQPYRLGEFELELSASVGIAVFPSDGRTGEELLKKADDAMYRAKNSGKNTFRLYSDPS